MKAMRYLTIAAAQGATACLSGQVIDFVFITKLIDYEQTDVATVSPITNPYLFSASVSGTGLDGSNPAPPNTVSVPNGSVTLVTLDPPDMFNEEWQKEDGGYASVAAIDAAYGSGTYVFNFGAQSVNLTLGTGDLYPNAPVLTISTNNSQGLTWSGGILMVDPSLFTTMTIGVSDFVTNFSASANHIGVFGNGFQTNLGFELFNDADGVISATFDVASTEFLLGGGSFRAFEAEFNNLINYTENSPSAGITSVSAFTTVTRLEMQVIPEPSTCAAIFGVVALAGVMIQRRRRSVVAT